MTITAIDSRISVSPTDFFELPTVLRRLRCKYHGRLREGDWYFLRVRQPALRSRFRAQFRLRL